jgi:predicted dehydrogenase
MAKRRDYALEGKAAGKVIAAPDLAYLPPSPRRWRPGIGVIGCGGISEYHLRAYRSQGWNVVALCNRTEAKARARQKEFYPRAAVYSDYREVLKRDDVEVVDVTTHPEERVAIIRDAIAAGKHVLSQKPFVTDLDVGERLVDLADRKGVRLAVNQNGRWAPHFAYMRAAVAKGLIGQPIAAHFGVHWDHNWVKGSPFEALRHLVLYDFGVHWFDMMSAFMGDKLATGVYASEAVSPSQKVRPPLLAQAIVEYDGAQGSIVFDADVRFGKADRSYVAGSRGVIESLGPSLTEQSVALHTPRGVARPKLKGDWFTNGFVGTMGELLAAVEASREPANGARENLRSLALCFAACASAAAGKPMTPGRVRRLPG